MNKAKKMRLISDDEYQQLIKQCSSPPSTTALESQVHMNQSQMDKQLYNKMGDDQKWKLYQGALHRMLDASGQLDKKPVKVQFDNSLLDTSDSFSQLSNSHPHSESEVSSFINLFPKGQQEKAVSVKQYLDDCDSIQWDEQSGEVSLHGNSVVKSHIADLVSYLIKPSRTKPVGASEFVSHLSKSNVPLSVIGNTTVRKLISKNRETPVEISSTTATPSKVKQIAYGKKGKCVRKKGQNRKGQNRKGGKKKTKTIRWKKFD
jgi:hypothetical protein